MKPPNMHKATIGQMVEWAANSNGKTTPKRQKLVDQILSQITWLDRLKDFPWRAREWADKAWHDIQAIGVTERLEVTSKPPFEPMTRIGNLRIACKCLGLNISKINGKYVIKKA